MTKSQCSSTLFPWEISPQDPKLIKQIRTPVHAITLNTVTKYKLYPYIQISLNHIFLIFKKLKTMKNDYVSMFINPFSLGNLPQDPKLISKIPTRVHAITLNTVTKSKLYAYIQVSLNHIFLIFKKLKTMKNDYVSMLINPFSLGHLPQDPKLISKICTRVHTITLNTVTKYKLYPYIQISLNQIFEMFKNLKSLKND